MSTYLKTSSLKPALLAAIIATGLTISVVYGQAIPDTQKLPQSNQGTGNMQVMPGTGNMQGMAGMGNMQSMPGMGNMPGMAGTGNMQGMPGMANMQGMPMQGMGGMNGGGMMPMMGGMMSMMGGMMSMMGMPMAGQQQQGASTAPVQQIQAGPSAEVLDLKLQALDAKLNRLTAMMEQLKGRPGELPSAPVNP